MLTDAVVRTAKPGRYSDAKGSGLMLEVRPTGGRFWVQRIMVAGKRRDLGLGSYPDTSLSDARAKALANREAVAEGRDILAERAAARAEAEAKAAGPAEAPPERTLSAAVTAWIAAKSPGWRNPKTGRQAREMLDNHAASIMARPVAAVDLAAVHGVLAAVWISRPALAVKVRGHLEAALEWAIAAGWRQGPNPALWKGGLRPLLARPDAVQRGRHHPALPWARVPAFMEVLRGEAGTAARALELCILTACRSGEARGAAWSEFDLGKKVWVIPAARAKSGRPHRVPIAPAAVTLLRSMMPADGRLPDPAGMVFANPKGVALSDMALLAVVRRMDAASAANDEGGWRDAEGAVATPHGFRSAWRDWCADHGHDRELAEAQLAHVVGSATERAYARSDVFERRRVLVETWCAFVTGEAAAGADAVVPLRRAGA